MFFEKYFYLFLFLCVTFHTSVSVFQSYHFPSLGKRVQKYALFKYAPNLNHSFFELFLRIEAKVLNYKDVVEHIFSDTGGKAERGTPYYIHTRVRRARPRAYAQGKGWRKRGLKD